MKSRIAAYFHALNIFQCHDADHCLGPQWICSLVRFWFLNCFVFQSFNVYYGQSVLVRWFCWWIGAPHGLGSAEFAISNLRTTEEIQMSYRLGLKLIHFVFPFHQSPSKLLSSIMQVSPYKIDFQLNVLNEPHLQILFLGTFLSNISRLYRYLSLQISCLTGGRNFYLHF